MWAREQSEELSPHLTTFTEHFNNMSYWCATRVLTQDDPRDRERLLMKLIKIMRVSEAMKWDAQGLSNVTASSKSKQLGAT